MKTLEQLAAALKQRRQALDLNQKDMLMKIGMSQQQYQRIEAGGDVRLSTLLRVLEGMDLELMLLPREAARRTEEWPVETPTDTLPYVRDEQEMALNMAHEKRWSQISWETFSRWAQRSGVAWSAIRVHLEEALQRARAEWPDRLAALPMHDAHKAALRAYWSALHRDFQL